MFRPPLVIIRPTKDNKPNTRKAQRNKQKQKTTYNETDADVYINCYTQVITIVEGRFPSQSDDVRKYPHEIRHHNFDTSITVQRGHTAQRENITRFNDPSKSSF
jgi:hypothetical protein